MRKGDWGDWMVIMTKQSIAKSITILKFRLGSWDEHFNNLRKKIKIVRNFIIRNGYFSRFF